MKLFKLTNVNCDWDEFFQILVAAPTEKEARAFASVHDCNKGKLWNNSEFATCEEVPFESGVLLADFNAG